MQATEAASARADERRMLGESVADFAQRATDMARVRKWRGVEPGYDRALWREMAAMGWTGLLIALHNLREGSSIHNLFQKCHSERAPATEESRFSCET